MMTTQVVLIVLVVLLISGCSFLPAPLAYLNYARTGFDVKQVVTGEPTISDVILSSQHLALLLLSVPSPLAQLRLSSC